MLQRYEPARRARRLVAAAFLAIAASANAASGVESSRPSPYVPYAFLIGEWDVASEGGGAPTMTALFRFGPGESYLWFAVSELADGKQKPHLEGMFVWNGVHRNFDMLLAVGLDGAGFEEQGVLFVEADGTVVRDITAVYPEGARAMGHAGTGSKGATARFRQTFKAVGPDRVLTTVMRETGKGWVATFPGSDRLVMTRRGKA